MAKNYQRLYDSTMTRASKPNYAKSFEAWHQLAALTRKAALMVTSQYEADRNDILKEYSTTKAHEMLADLQTEYIATKKGIADSLKAELDAVVASKKAALSKACRSPKTEDLNLLQVLSMRSKLTDDDIVRAAENMGDNLLALAVLGDIADKHGINLPIPTADRFEDKINKAEKYCEERLDELFSNDLTYWGAYFFDHPELAPNYPKDNGDTEEYFTEIDSSPFTTEQSFGSPKHDMAELKEAVKARHDAEQRKQDGIQTSYSGAATVGA